MPTRREFIAATSASVLATSLLGELGADHPALAAPRKAAPEKSSALPGKGHIVRVSSEAMVKGEKPDPGVTAKVLEQGILEFTGRKTAADGWAALFSEKDTVGIKINCLGKPKMSTTPEVVLAIIAGLKSAGVREDRIWVFDLFGSHMTMSRYRLQTSEKGVRYVHNQQMGYEEFRKLPWGKVQLANTLLKADKIVSVPVLKNHALSGVTCALKNMAFGCVSKPSAFHRNNCDPGIANIYNLPEVKDKVSLIVCDGAFIQHDGGPQFTPAARSVLGSLFLTRDPVAMDKLAWELLDERRKAKRLAPIEKSGGKTIHIATAAGLGLGTDDRAKIKVVEKKV